MGDCHLGGWRQPELKELNFLSFQTAVNKCIKEKIDFILITGDLFDAPYPSIDTLKDAFNEFRKLREAQIPVFLIAGSHDYSASGKTFLDVLEKAGFCKNVCSYEEKNNSIILLPIIYKNVALYGYPGKKSSLEIEDIEKIKLQDSPGLFKILMLHTAIRDAVPNLAIKAVDQNKLPEVDYLALSHLHINYSKPGRAYSGPLFPNNLSELEELQAGFFYIFDNGKIKKQEIKLKPVVSLNLEIKNALSATGEITSYMEYLHLKDSIFILKLSGILEQGKTSDIDFQGIESLAIKKGAYVFLKSTSRLHMPEPEITLEILDTANLENEIIRKFEETNPCKFNQYIFPLIKSLQIEKLDDERSAIFEDRVMTEVKKVLGI